jgi:hypothetical protein
MTADARHLFAGIPVSDRALAGDWYERLLGRTPDLVPNEVEACWQVNDGGWIYFVVDADRAGTALHTLLVEDLDAVLAGLAARGIEPGPVELVGGAVAQSIVSDPDGNRLKLAQLPAGA